MSKQKIILALLLSFITQWMMAQGVVISGTVEDAMGPVMLANVTERDGNDRIVNATQTDMMGNFSMEIKNTKNKLVVSYVGSKTWTKVIGNQISFNIKLEDEKTTLNEVTVRGRRANSGGLNIQKKEISVSQQTFNLSEVEGMAFTSADEALQGEIAGLDIVSNSGNLGAGTTMRLRGVSTLTGNSQPLIVVDDKIFDYNEDFDAANADNEAFSSLLAISVEDIADITVLKDAAATAIWGSQGANGVIQIKTKRGSRGKPRVNLGYKFTGTWMPTGYKLLNGDQYTMMLKEEFYNKDMDPSVTDHIEEINYNMAGYSDARYWNRNTDWVDEVKQFGQLHEASLNVQGGGQKATFRISASYNHQTGSIIKQVMDRLTTTLVLDYNVSDRIKFSTNFGLTYSQNEKNYTYGSSKNGNSNNNILAMALAMAPNMAVTRENGEYYLMNRSAGSAGYDIAGTPFSSYEMRHVYAIGNPVAYANTSWQTEKTYSIRPDFNLKYELLGTGNDQTRLTFDGRVYFDVFAYSLPTYMPASLSNRTFTDDNYNYVTNTEKNNFKLGARAQLIFTPYFRNQDFSLTMLARYECITGRYSLQSAVKSHLPNGMETIDGVGNNISLSNSLSTTRSASQNWVYNAHFSYKERYNISFSLRGDGNSSFGPDNPWFYAPSVSLRYNLSDEKFFEPLRKVVSMFGIRGSWGITGRPAASVTSFYNTYTKSAGTYGSGDSYITMSGLKLTDLKPEKKNGLNLGFNLGFLNDLIEVDLNLYKETTSDLIVAKAPLPSSTGYPHLDYANIGKMENKGWELSITGKKFIKVKKFSLSANLNMAQNRNELLEMNKDVLANYNDKFEDKYDKRGAASRLNKVQIGAPLCSIYGYQSKGVFQYSYEYLQNFDTKMRQQNPNWTSTDYENQINQWLAEGKTFPVATDANGHVIMKTNGQPQPLVYVYNSDNNTAAYTFKGGDAFYEDINHDGQINELDIVYLGNSLPKLQGGFSLTAQYGDWKFVARFTYRWGNKILNAARMGLESMFGTENQCASVAYRWRKDGDETLIPRALYDEGYNYQVSSRFVEDGAFLRFQNFQVSYSFPRKMIKKWGLNKLTAYVTMNNVFCWTKYTGIDPEVSASTYAPAIDSANTPRAKSITASLNFGF